MFPMLHTGLAPGLVNRLPRLSPSINPLNAPYPTSSSSEPEYYHAFEPNEALVEAFSGSVPFCGNGQDASIATNLYPSTENPRQWHSTSVCRGPSVCDIEMTGKYAPSSDPYSNSGILSRSHGDESLPAFPTLESLASSLPMAPLEERVLPEPRGPALGGVSVVSQNGTSEASHAYSHPAPVMRQTLKWDAGDTRGNSEELATSSSGGPSSLNGARSDVPTTSFGTGHASFKYLRSSRDPLLTTNLSAGDVCENLGNQYESASCSVHPTPHPTEAILEAQSHNLTSYNHRLARSKENLSSREHGAVVIAANYSNYAQTRQHLQRTPSIDLRHQSSEEITSRTTPRLSPPENGAAARH